MTWDRGWLIHRYDRVTSTMDIAAQHARFGAPDRTAIVAAEQTHGRGRGGRFWHSPPGESVSCTLLLRPRVAPKRLSTLPLVTGVAVAEAIERVTDLPVQLKWPNDAWIGADPDRRKVAGILMTSHLAHGEVDHVLVGVGINVGGQHADLPPGATSLTAATTARGLTGIDLSPDVLLAALLDRFDQAYADFLATRGQPPLEAWVHRAALRGEQVMIEDAGRRRSGIFLGIDKDGALLLQESDGTIARVVAGDVTCGPRAAMCTGCS